MNRNLYIENITIVILHDEYNDRYIITKYIQVINSPERCQICVAVDKIRKKSSYSVKKMKISIQRYCKCVDVTKTLKFKIKLRVCKKENKNLKIIPRGKK